MPNRVELHIVVDAKGQINVTGPLHDKIMCYGLLESARDVIQSFKPSPIVHPNGAPMAAAQPGKNS